VAHNLYVQAESLRAQMNDSNKLIKTNATNAFNKLQAQAANELRLQQTEVAAMQANAEVLKSRYGHIYEVGGAQGADNQFYPYAKMRPRPPAPPTPSRQARTLPIRRPAAGMLGTSSRAPRSLKQPGGLA
jgi:hypothetical protein